MFLSLKLSLNGEKTSSVTPPVAAPYYYVTNMGSANGSAAYLQPSSTDRYIRP